jgi:EAL domain-containing protein (putative c-di-GMP-specific phosphodiesterase class I)
VNRRGAVIGVEGLLRWRHPERGLVPPAYFVRIAEECGLIDDLGMFTLRRAFEDSRRWESLRVAINVSASQLRLKDFAEKLSDLVWECKVDPRRFELEITEGVLLGDDVTTQETLRHLRQMGFSLALDDFGTGYSSLSYLQRYPVDKIKIDRSFITNLGADTEAEAVVGAIVKLARALKLSVIAEGVETLEQRERLTAVGCSEVQGFLYSKAVAADEIDELLRMPSLLPQEPEVSEAA